MLINMPSDGLVKFVKYTGKYPNLCSGTLTLEIEGKEYVFGYGKKDGEPKPQYERFWRSGGSCSVNYGTEYGEWEIDASLLPKELMKHAAEIDRVFNENVEHGCCGGCI